ncbi:MAG: tetraacyldisaccharide 4'-kinase [Candidatus Riflebacteria bacterium]|nr:tetraacyldisaccharide 4'-kinase [Candidatus Riflebacteria bacterium]
MMSCLSAFYGLLTGLERNFFATFPFLCYKPSARVISVGNLSMGGTGKTPLLFELLSELEKFNTCVLSRGYRSPWEKSFYYLQGTGPHPRELTDEALLLNARFPQTPVLLGKNRHHSAIVAEKRFKPQLILLDDGFQYRRLRKDIDLVLWDAMSEPREAQMIPAGRLREPIWRLSQASAVFLTRCESAGSDMVDYWLKWIATQAPNVPVIMTKTICEGLYDYRSRKFAILPSARKYLAFSAIGRPDSFYCQLESLGCSVLKKVEFRDHHRFTDAELKSIGEQASVSQLQPVCTEKDFCKISPDIAEKLNIAVLRIRTVPSSGRTFSEELAAHNILLAL